MTEKTKINLQNAPLMEGISDIENLAACFDARVRTFRSGECIVGYGESPQIVILTEGNATVLSEDYFGNRNIVSRLKSGGMFGAAFFYADCETSFRLVADTNEEAVFFSGERLHSPCEKACPDHLRFLQNAMRAVSRNCVGFLEKLEHLSRRTTREKVLSYLTAQSVKQCAKEFEIPFSRQELADYLAVDRSALSAELGKMQKDGLLAFRRSKFRLLTG